MSVTKYNFTPDGLVPDNVDVGIKADLLEWAKCPEAFLLSDSEIVLVNKARQLLQDMFKQYINVDKKDFTKELRKQLGLEYIELLKRKRVSITKLKKLTDKLQTMQYWSAYLTEVKIKNGIIQRFKVITSNPDIKVSPDNIIDKTTHPKYFEAENRGQQAKAIGIPDMYFYISEIDLDVLRILTVIFSYEAKPDSKVKPIPEESDIFYSVISSNQLNGFSAIGSNIKNPEVKTTRNEKGKQIELTEYATNIGVTLSFADFNPFNCTDKDISVGDPNTDKLLLQIQLTCRKTQKQSFEIPFADFMKFRGLSDKKSALDQAKQGCNTLLSARYILESENDKVSVVGGVNYVQECYVVTQGKQSGKGNTIYVNLSDKLYNHIISLNDKGQQIEQLDKRAVTIPNNQQTAYNIFRVYSRHLRQNADRPTSHRLSVKTLLSYCSSLPLYPYNDSDKGKKDYLRKRSEAKDRIISKFVKALDYLVDNNYFNEWTFTKTNGTPLTDTELSKVFDDYSLFSSLNVDVKFTNEPDYNHLIESKTKQKAKADKVKKNNQAKNKGT